MADRTAETIRRWIWSGRLKATRRGNRLLVARHDLEEVVGLASSKADRPGTLHQWAAEVRAARRSARLGEPGRHKTAADLVLSNRADRDAS